MDDTSDKRLGLTLLCMMIVRAQRCKISSKTHFNSECISLSLSILSRTSLIRHKTSNKGPRWEVKVADLERKTSASTEKGTPSGTSSAVQSSTSDAKEISDSTGAIALTSTAHSQWSSTHRRAAKVSKTARIYVIDVSTPLRDHC